MGRDIKTHLVINKVYVLRNVHRKNIKKKTIPFLAKMKPGIIEIVTSCKFVSHVQTLSFFLNILLFSTLNDFYQIHFCYIHAFCNVIFKTQ